MAAFLVAIGTMVDLDYFRAHMGVVVGLSVLALVVNTVVNTVALKLQRRPWRRALYGGALLAQIGEFSFVLAAVGMASGIINADGYQLAISVIAPHHDHGHRLGRRGGSSERRPAPCCVSGDEAGGLGGCSS